ncbi:hypothetical protein ACG9YX_00750 [Acinetobacter nematophilus]|uniref:hypothetical protein n=1 Tax=Acinetobacter nematophilus TaxID=2994642 RepID=UPI003AF83233
MKISVRTVCISAQLLTQFANAEAVKIPTVPEAKQATAELLGTEISAMISEVKLGTCIPAVNATHSGQIACTVSVKLGAATNETQSDFYQDKDKWVAMPSESQDKLPFPDPKLH